MQLAYLKYFSFYLEKIDKQGNLLDYGFCRKTASISKVKISKWMDESTQASTVSN